MSTFGTTEITIDNGAPMAGHFEIETEVISYRSSTATAPRMSWTQVDANGHWHAYAQDGELPTLTRRVRHVDCDFTTHPGDGLGECDGYDVSEWHCRICDEEIQPERVADTGEKSMPGRKSWSAEINPEREIKGDVTVRVKSGERVLFGVARASTASMEGDSNGIRITTRLDGIGPLGERHG